MNYDNLSTTNKMSEQIRDKYCKESYTCRYRVRSIVEQLSYNLNN